MLTRSDAPRPSATLGDAAFLQGRWVGTGIGSIAEETWGQPKSSVMLCMARIDKNGAPWFYELVVLAEVQGSLELRLKHFNPDLTGWEEKAQVQTFPLVRSEPGTLWFDGMTFHRVSDEELEVWVRIHGRDGAVKDEPFRYRREP